MLCALHDNIIISQIEPESKTSAGIILTTQESSDSTTGVVISVGPGVFEYGILRGCSVQPGDQILYSKFAGTKITDKGQNYLILKDKELLAVEKADTISVVPTPVNNN